MSVVAMPPYPSTIPGGFTVGQLEVAIVLLVDVIRVSRIRRRSADARHTPSRPNAYHG
jgi:hypothetical protein